MDEIAQLAQQVKIVGDTIEAQMQRLEQVIKIFLDEKEALTQEREVVAKEKETTQDLNRALTQSLNDSDSQIDDLSTITAALTQLRETLAKAMETEEQGG